MTEKTKPIYERKNGCREAGCKRGTGANGKTLYSTVYSQSSGEARGKPYCYDEGGKLLNYSPQNSPTFADVIFMWKKANANRCKDSTALKYENLIENHILPTLGKYKLFDIDTFLLADFMDSKLTHGRIDNSGGLAPSYVRSIMRVVFEVIDFAAEENMCEPLKSKARIRTPAAKRHDMEILDVRTQAFLEKQLLMCLDETAAGILISLNTGLRIGEICALKWDDIDFENAVLHVRSTVARVKNTDGSSATKLIIDMPKTKSSFRDIPISSYLMNVLPSLYKSRKSEYIVSDKIGFVSPRTFSYRFHKLLEKYHIKQINYHALRHTFATRCIEYGVDVKTLSEILGHSSATITLNTYVHSSMERKREQLEKLKINRT